METQTSKDHRAGQKLSGTDSRESSATASLAGQEPMSKAGKSRGPKKRFGSRHLSIRSYLIIMNLVLLCLLFPTVSFFFLNEDTKFRDSQLQQTIRQMRQNLETKGSSLAHILALGASQAIAGYDFTSLAILFQEVVANDPEMVYAIIMSGNGKAMVHSVPEKMGSILNAPIDRYAADVLENNFPKMLDKEQPPEMIFFRDDVIRKGGREEPVMEVLAPVYSGAHLWGILRCGYSLVPFQKRIARVEKEWAAKLDYAKRYFLTISGIFFSIGVLVAALFTRFFVRSMRVLNDGVDRVSQGNLEYTINQDRMACAEFVNLSQAFNNMTAKLKKSYDQLDEYSKSLEQKVEERTKELREAQNNLIQQAHEAGMAEMAVGILHNIGNAITPAKVGTTLLLKRLRDNPAQQQLEEAMRQFHKALTHSCTASREEKDRLLNITHLLPQSIEEEIRKTIDELQRIETKHEHIENIISLQMRYAQLFGDNKEVDINQVAEDALSMFENTLGKQGVQVAKHFASVPPVHIEQAKLIQVVINLIKNAYEAMANVPAGEKQLTVTSAFEPGQPGRVLLSIRDTGNGFSEEQKKQMFQFGYSTKAKGSGFGLHSCANFLIANHGSIEAHSDGEGKGAEFTISLPAAVQPGNSNQQGEA